MKVGIIGGGAWGTALAAISAEQGETILWARNEDVVAMVNRDHANPLYLPDVTLPASLRATGDLGTLKDCGALVLAVPAQSLRHFGGEIARHLPNDAPIVIAAKGIEIATGRLPSDVLAETLPGAKLAILTGPNFATEIARGLPAAATLACAEAELGTALVQRLGRPTFRPYLSDDVIGAQVGGAVKNVLAIACGIVIGRRLGDNARAALITRGLAEMTRLGLSLGAKRETLMGLSGLGDLVLTCSGPQSRNLSLGVALGEGGNLQEILASRRSVAEGVFTARAIEALAKNQQIEMPICAAVDAILHRGASIDDALQALLARPFRAED